MTASRRGHVPTELGALTALIDSFELALEASDRRAKTKLLYSDAVRWFAGWLITQDVAAWSEVGKLQVRRFLVHLKDLGYAQTTQHNVGQCIAGFFGFLETEEDYANPFKQGVEVPAGPKMGELRSRILPTEDMERLIKEAEKGRDFVSRRDAALLRIFASTGCRLSEITNLKVGDVNLKERHALVTGKGGKGRTIRFDQKCALAIDRYQRRRADLLRGAQVDALWVGSLLKTPMTTSGIRQMMERRGKDLGIHLHPHLFRHTFSHNWLDAGGAEGDLMELNGWDSEQMLRHYGRSARGARARRAYDRIDVMRGV